MDFYANARLPPGIQNRNDVTRNKPQNISASSQQLNHNYRQNSGTNSNSLSVESMTPGQSIDEFHSSELGDLLWQQEMEHNGTSFMDMLNGPDPVLLGDDRHTDPQAALFHNIPSPNTTSNSTPNASHNHNLSDGPLITSPAAVHSQSSQPDTNQDPVVERMARAQAFNGPSIQISSYNRGDSPGRLEIPQRVTKKRSASRLSEGGDYFAEIAQDSLAPPQINDDLSDGSSERDGHGPDPNNHDEIPSFADMERRAHDDQTVSDVQAWLSRINMEDKINVGRSRSTGTKNRRPLSRPRRPPPNDKLVDETSEYYYSDGDDAGSDVSLYETDHPETIAPHIPDRKASIPAPREDELEPLPSQFLRQPWQDPFPVRRPDDPGVRVHEATAAMSMYRYELKAKAWDAASKYATWGTSKTRKLSEADIASIMSKQTRHPSIPRLSSDRIVQSVNEMRNRAGSILKRANSKNRKASEPVGQDLERVASPESVGHRESTDSVHRQNSRPGLHKSKSPSLTGALMAMTSNVTAVAQPQVHPHEHESFIQRIGHGLRRMRSGSHMKSPTSPSHHHFWQHDQPNAAPRHVDTSGHKTEDIAQMQSTEVEEPEYVPNQPDVLDVPQPVQPPVTNIDFSPHMAPLIIPNKEGFQAHIRELNPDLEPWLVERIMYDQLRRYKALSKKRVDHYIAVAEGKCESKELCNPSGETRSDILPSKHKELSGFRIQTGEDDDDLDDTNFDGMVTAALFPEGIPLPPTERLPARFECPLCFQVKTFQKPSDWTKHVHEDVMPFTCTFLSCPEPKPFKRKADWVRHENERHRHLEWWECNLTECKHKCYRKDNFVQHLVREHKKKEPKIKNRSKTGRGKEYNDEEREFWSIVDSCRHDSQADPRKERCKFCGVSGVSWKKLSVHVAKHMEQIAMPVLKLAAKRNINESTIISPVEQPPPRQTYTSMDASMSPHSSNHTFYQSSSTDQSPMLSRQIANPGRYQVPGLYPQYPSYIETWQGSNPNMYNQFPSSMRQFGQVPINVPMQQIVPRQVQVPHTTARNFDQDYNAQQMPIAGPSYMPPHYYNHNAYVVDMNGMETTEMQPQVPMSMQAQMQLPVATIQQGLNTQTDAGVANEMNVGNVDENGYMYAPQQSIQQHMFILPQQPQPQGNGYHYYTG